MKMAGIIAVFFVLILTLPVMARSGCCSHHGGVRADGCGCNDGTPLSSTCAPYYVCTQVEPPVQNIVYPTSTPYPTRIPTIRPTASPTATPTIIPTATPTLTPTSTPTPATTVTPTPFEVSKEVKGTEDSKKKTFFDYFFDASIGRMLFPQLNFFSIFQQ